MRRSMLIIAAGLIATCLFSQPIRAKGLAGTGASVAVFDFFNLSDDATYDHWESLFGRGLRRGLFTRKEIGIVPYPAVYKALADLQVDDYFITPEQIPPIGVKVGADLAVLGSFNIEEGVVACSIKVVDADTGKILEEDIRFGSTEESDAFLLELQAGLEKMLFGEEVEVPPEVSEHLESQAPSPLAAEETRPEESPWTPIAQVAPIVAPVELVQEQPSVSLEGPGAPSEMVDVEETSSQPVTPSGGMVPSGLPHGVAVQNVLNDAWRRSTNPQTPTTGPRASSPNWSSTTLPPPGAAFGNPTRPTPPRGDPFATVTGQSAPPRQAQAPPPRFEQTPGAPPFARPIEAEIPRLQPAPPPRMDSVRAPFQPMNVQPAQPPAQMQQYPYVPPNPNQGLVPQGQPRPGPISRFFGWFGRRFRGGDDNPGDQSNSRVPPRQPLGRDRNLWIDDNRQSSATPKTNEMESILGEAGRVLVANLPPRSAGIVTDTVPGYVPIQPQPVGIQPGSVDRNAKEETFQPKGLEGWAKTYFDAGNYDLAEDAYQKALYEEPKNANLHFNLAQAQLASGKEDAALKSLERAAAIRPADAETLKRLGALYAKKGEWGKAIDTYTTLVLDRPWDPEAFNRLGMAFDRAGRPRDALRAFRKALTLDPKNAHAAHHAAVVFEKLNRPREAQAYARLAAALSNSTSG